MLYFIGTLIFSRDFNFAKIEEEYFTTVRLGDWVAKSRQKGTKFRDFLVDPH